MKVAVLTGGGDCPGLNAVIRAVVRRTMGKYGGHVVGFRYGWAGVIDNKQMPLGLEQVSGILPRGGTILGTSRTNPYRVEGGFEAIKKTIDQEKLDGLIAIGGEDTLGVAHKLYRKACPSSACPRPSTTTSTARTSRSASTRPSTSRPRRSTGCTRRPNHTTAWSWSR